MPNLLERLAARLAFLHASHVFRRFSRQLADPEAQQLGALRRVVRLVGASDYGRRFKLDRVRSVQDLRRAVPIATYDDFHPYIERVTRGETGALLARSTPILMFATSSGTTARSKYIPVTPEFVRQYRRGWNTFGLKMLSDHPQAVLRAILQGSGRHDESHTSSGVPCGAITGMLARTQKGIVRRFYVGAPEIAHLADARARYYTLMRFGVMRDVAFAITANPATLVRMAQTLDRECETLVRDVHNGTLSAEIVTDAATRRRLESHLQPAPQRARELDALKASNGTLRPVDFWRLSFLACWTGGSMGYYLERLASWYGGIPVRDIGLLASEGRITIPLEDGTPAGVLDSQAAVFEFIPLEDWPEARGGTRLPSELETGRDYVVVLSNDAGLVRYRLDDVVRVRGWVGATPVLEFLHRAGRVASLAGEKLTEHQVVEAVRVACSRLAVPEFDYVVGPQWGDPPRYVISASVPIDDGLLAEIDRQIGAQNLEYDSRRKSLRLGSLGSRHLGPGAIERMDARLCATRKSTTEQFKRPCLFTEPGADNEALGLPVDGR